MNDFEALLLLTGVAVACYYVARHRARNEYDRQVAEVNKEWAKVFADQRQSLDKLILTSFHDAQALRFYADPINWCNGFVKADGGRMARLALHPSVNKNETKVSNQKAEMN
jgi:hypothetical protein